MQGFQGKKNIYLCHDCGHGFISKDIHDGVTPFMTTCLNCKAPTAQSLWYKYPQVLLQDATAAVNWVRPLQEEWGRYSPAVQDHLAKGGLIRSDQLKGQKKRKAFRP